MTDAMQRGTPAPEQLALPLREDERLTEEKSEPTYTLSLGERVRWEDA